MAFMEEMANISDGLCKELNSYIKSTNRLYHKFHENDSQGTKNIQDSHGT